MKRKIPWRALCFGLCAALFLFSGAMLLTNHAQEKREADQFSRLAALVAPAATPAPSPARTRAPAATATASAPTPGPGVTPAPTVNPRYAQLLAMNSDFYGWLTIPGTPIDYPVMWTPQEPEYYLHRSFEGQQSFAGVPFVGMGHAPGALNTILYGHNMNNGSMFAALTDYGDKSFWALHPTITFNSLYEDGEYEILAAFRSQAYGEQEEGVFRYHQYYDIQTQDEFTEYITACEEAALYDTGVRAQWGDKLLTLSTCGYHAENGRFVVVARKLR